SVAWITEMKNTQSAFFYLLAISCFLQSRDRKRNGIFYWLTIFFFVAAITSKPSTLMLPVLLALCLGWREGGIAQRDRRLTFAFAYFVITLFPVLDFFDVYFFRYSFVSDHFQYLASMGPLALAGAGVVTAVEKIAIHRLRIQTAATLGILLILSALTFHQSA